MKDYNEVPEDLPSPEEMWAKLVSNEPSLADFQYSLDELMKDK